MCHVADAPPAGPVEQITPRSLTGSTSSADVLISIFWASQFADAERVSAGMTAPLSAAIVNRTARRCLINSRAISDHLISSIRKMWTAQNTAGLAQRIRRVYRSDPALNLHGHNCA